MKAEKKSKPAKPLDMEDDSSIQVSGEDIKRLANLAKRQVDLEAKLSAVQDTESEIVEDLRILKTEMIPILMKEIGVKQFTLDSGEKVEVREIIKASIPTDPAKRKSALDWLRKNGHEGLIKNDIIAHFGRGEDEKARKLFEYFVKKKVDAENKITVNANTLAAFVKEQLEGGKKIPLDKLGVFVISESKITTPKSKALGKTKER